MLAKPVWTGNTRTTRHLPCKNGENSFIPWKPGTKRIQLRTFRSPWAYCSV